jgi:hypothetical protein|tara:strand:+ start:1488 stop:2351 length:864 start_codon:yes stop_codon:yes gene_type:complete
MKILILFLTMKLLIALNEKLIKSVNPVQLRNHIFEEANKNYKSLTYQKARTIMKKEFNMIDIYGDNLEEKNVEHIFPQSLFKNHTNNKIIKSDLHNLYLCNSKLNSHRQNFKYVDPSEFIDDNNNYFLNLKGEKENTFDGIYKNNGYLMVLNRKKRLFIPTEYSRGKISRSLAYFSIKYNYVNKLSQVINFKTLLMWNIKDPVDNEEYLKNILCYKHQNNLNPFILNSDLMQYCFTDFYEMEKEELRKKKQSIIDPMYTIDYLIKQNKENEIKINKYDKILKNLNKL